MGESRKQKAVKNSGGSGQEAGSRRQELHTNDVIPAVSKAVIPAVSKAVILAVSKAVIPAVSKAVIAAAAKAVIPAEAGIHVRSD